MEPHPAIAIDGPAASGKSTVAKRVAKELGYTFINTGAMYRAYTWYLAGQGVDFSDAGAISSNIKDAPLSFGSRDSQSTILYNGRELGEELTSPEVTKGVSIVAAIPAVREYLVACQRAYRQETPVVMEGRDIGSVVFPDTPFKYYLDASEEVRALRRRKEGITDSIAERDKNDSSRATAPLVVADGAKVIDTTHMTIEEVVGTIVDDIRSRLS